MKKFAKVSLATAGILAALGFVLCLISSLIGGRNAMYWVKNDSRVIEKLDQVTDKLDDAFEHFHYAGNWHFGWEDGNPRDLTVNDHVVSYDAGWPWEAQQSLDGVRNLNLMLGAGSLVLKEKDASDGMIDIYVQGKAAVIT